MWKEGSIHDSIVDPCCVPLDVRARFENSPPCCQQTWQSLWFREHTSTQLRMQDDNERVNKMTLPSKKEEEEVGKGIKWGKLNFRHFVVDFVRPAAFPCCTWTFSSFMSILCYYANKTL